MKTCYRQRKWFLQGLVAGVSVLVCLASWAVEPDRYAHVITYERSLGGHHPVSSFYLSMQPGASSVVYADSTAKSAQIRTPLYSTDKRQITLFNPLPMLRADEEDATGQEGESIATGLKKAAGSFIAITLVLGPYIYSMAQSINEFGDEFEESLAIDLCKDGGCDYLDDLSPDSSNEPDS